MNNAGHNTSGRNSDRYCRSVRHVSGDTPENLQIALRNLFFYSFEVETSTRSQNVQQTPSDSTHCLSHNKNVCTVHVRVQYAEGFK